MQILHKKVLGGDDDDDGLKLTLLEMKIPH